MRSEWSQESNHGFRIYLYYVFLIFVVARVCSVEQWPTQAFKNLKRRRWSLARRRRQWESDACFNPLTPFPNTLAHLAQLVKAFTVPRCSHMSPVRTMPGPFGFSLLQNSYFHIFILFNILHIILIIFIFLFHALKIIKIFFPFAFIFRKYLFNL